LITAQQNFAVAIYKFFGFECPNATASHAQTLMLRGQRRSPSARRTNDAFKILLRRRTLCSAKI